MPPVTAVEPRPCLSVVMPAFNEEATLTTSAKRVLESPWCAELLIVDDGSTDATLVAARDVAAGDPRVRVIEQRSEEHTSELQSLMRTSYAVFCLKKKKKEQQTILPIQS